MKISAKLNDYLSYESTDKPSDCRIKTESTDLILLVNNDNFQLCTSTLAVTFY